MSTRHGRCMNCQTIWRWQHRKGTPLVTRGEAFCQGCGCQLHRTAARLAKHFPIRDGAPIHQNVAAILQARRRVRRTT